MVSMATADAATLAAQPQLAWLSDEVHLRLSMLVMELAHVTPLPNGPAYFRYYTKHFAHIGPDGLDGAAAVMQRCLDAVTWEQVLWLYVHHNIQGVESAQDIVHTCQALAESGYVNLTPAQRVKLLHFLVTETLGSEYLLRFTYILRLRVVALDTPIRTVDCLRFTYVLRRRS